MGEDRKFVAPCLWFIPFLFSRLSLPVFPLGPCCSLTKMETGTADEAEFFRGGKSEQSCKLCARAPNSIRLIPVQVRCCGPAKQGNCECGGCFSFSKKSVSRMYFTRRYIGRQLIMENCWSGRGWEWGPGRLIVLTSAHKLFNSAAATSSRLMKNSRERQVGSRLDAQHLNETANGARRQSFWLIYIFATPVKLQLLFDRQSARRASGGFDRVTELPRRLQSPV